MLSVAARARRARPILASVALIALVASCSSDADADADGSAAAPAESSATGDSTATSTTTSTTEPASEGSEPAAPPEASPADAWPDPDWQEVDPRAAGFDPAALRAAAERAGSSGTSCLAVTRAGQLVGEWYWNGGEPDAPKEAFSVTKSITSTLVGIAQDEGLLELDDPASTWIDEWRGTPSEEVTVRNLVSNDSGRFQTFDSDYVEMIQSEDRTAFAVGLDQQHEPGTEWVYNNAAIQTLDVVLEEATGMPPHEFATERLFEPIGMDDTHISTDPAGNTQMFMGAQTTCRDLARFGLLFLREGSWDGEQIVSQRWVREATTPSQDLNPEYGFLWWLDPDGDEEGSGGGGGGDVPGGPADSYAALGLNEQVVAVFPELDLVVTRMGGPAADGSNFGIDDIIQHVVPALEDR